MIKDFFGGRGGTVLSKVYGGDLEYKYNKLLLIQNIFQKLVKIKKKNGIGDI